MTAIFSAALSAAALDGACARSRPAASASASIFLYVRPKYTCAFVFFLSISLPPDQIPFLFVFIILRGILSNTDFQAN
jgi:hypothetical protein